MFAHTGLADEQRMTLRLALEDGEQAIHLAETPDDDVAALFGAFDEVKGWPLTKSWMVDVEPAGLVLMGVVMVTGGVGVAGGGVGVGAGGIRAAEFTRLSSPSVIPVTGSWIGVAPC